MSYSAAISRSNPTCFLFVIDQSASMDERMVSGKSKSQFLSDVLNKTLAEAITRCSKAEGVRDYFEVGVVAYSGDTVRDGWGGGLRGSMLHPISKIAERPLRIEDRVKNIDDGVGGLLEQKVKFPVWFEPESAGGTPMKAGLTKAAEILADWCDAHRSSYPPTIFHITDGQSTDGDPEDVANVIRQLATDDGQVLLFSLHIDTGSGNEITFPTSESILPDQYSRQLFRMSSLFPPSLIEAARGQGYSVNQEARFFVYKAGMEQIVRFFDIGTRAANLR